ncbi:MAG: 16S rRNA (adenine(1518)-N(6)/adenine(1519)-N(6))-dimethyltransferase RsmA [Gammaproteobacteria bacterium]
MNAHRPRKRFGQHFLIDQFIIEKIVNLIAPSEHKNIIEIGPGEGVLTQHLLDRGAEVTAIEIDRDLATSLNKKFSSYANFHLINDDVLKCDFASIGGAMPGYVVGNLPYNISTPLLLHLLSNLAPIAEMIFMLQKEVVERMCAQPGNGTYGRLTILTQTHCTTQNVFSVPPSAFRPPPKVDSAVVRLRPLNKNIGENVRTALATLTQQAFSQRRKKLKTGLKTLFSPTELQDLGIDPEQRPDMVSVDSYVKLAKLLAQRARPSYGLAT